MKILLVDDDPMIRETLGSALERFGHNVMLAANGMEAQDFLQKRTFDVLVIDIIMPFREGIETICAVRKSGRDIKIVAISGGGRTGMSDFLEIAVRAGADITLKKPFRTEALIQTIDELQVRVIPPEAYIHTRH